MVLQFVKLNYNKPIENIVKIVANVNFQRVAYSVGLAYEFGNSLVYFDVLEKKSSPNTDIKTLSSKKEVTDALATLELPVKESFEASRKHIKTIRKSKLQSKHNCV